MRKKILLAMLVLLALVCAIALASCEGIVLPGVTGGTDNTDSSNNGDKDNDAGGDKTYLVKYYYEGEVVHQQSVKSGNTLTSFQLEERDGLGANGVLFTNFYADSAMTKEFDFDMKITKNVNVYCQILYTVSYYFGQTLVAVHKVDALSGYLTQAQADEVVDMLKVYIGLYTDKEKTVDFNPVDKITRSMNVYCKDVHIVDYVYIDFFGTEVKIEGLRQRVDAVDGFTEAQKQEVYEYLYNGFSFDYFYSDASLMTLFDFDSVPRKDTVVYCERDEFKAGKNVNWSISADRKTITFTGTGDMYDYKYNTDVPWYNYGAAIENIVIEEGITSVAGCAFYKFNKITSVTLPDTIKRINKNAFYESSITDINFPQSLESIGTSAFSNSEGLVYLDFNEGLTMIEGNAFADCVGLTTVVLTPTIMGFGASAFKNCINIESAYYIGTEEQFNKIDISVSNFWINQLAHKFFISQERPEKPGPFWYYNDDGEICQWYYTIWYYDNINTKLPFTVDYIDVENGISQANIDFMHNDSEINGTGHNGYKFVGWYLKGGSNKNHYEFTLGEKYYENIKLIGDRGNLCGDNVKWSFKSTGNILTISKVDKSLDDGAMWNFKHSNDAPWWGSYRTRISKIVIEDGITHIGSFAFSEIYDNSSTDYNSFGYIDIPYTVTSIHADAFYRCLRLLYIYYEGTAEDIYGTETIAPTIQGLSSLNCLTADGNVAIVYANATNADFATLGAGSYWAQMHTGAAQNDDLRVAWSYDAENGTLLVGGGDEKHIMINYVSHDQTPWYSYRNNVNTVIINKNITVVGYCSFEGMESVTSIVANNLITKIADTAFSGTGYYNTELANKGVVYIYTEGTEALRYCHLIKVDPAKAGELFVIPARTLSIADNAFAGCSGIKKLVFTKDIKTNAIYSTALTGLTALEAIYYDGEISVWSQYENVFGKVPENVKVLHYFVSKPVEGLLEGLGFGLDRCWHWKNNQENSEPVIWADEEA